MAELQRGKLSGSHHCTMTSETQMHLLLLSELVSAFRANHSDVGRPAVEELMLEWMNPLLIVEEMDLLVGLYLVVSLSLENP